MPYAIQGSGSKFIVVNKATGHVKGTHPSRRDALKQLRALYANVPEAAKGATVATETIHKKGRPPITFHKGGLHESTGTPAGQPIPAAKKAAALAGKLGPKAQKQAQFAKNVLTGPKKAEHGAVVVSSSDLIAEGWKESYKDAKAH
jgi:hypothetical protein